MKYSSHKQRLPKPDNLPIPAPDDSSAVVEPTVDFSTDDESQGHLTRLLNEPQGDLTAKGLSRDLHELLNSLWSASICIELALTEEDCIPEIHARLEQAGENLENAMKLTAEADKLIDPPQPDQLDT